METDNFFEIEEVFVSEIEWHDSVASPSKEHFEATFV